MNVDVINKQKDLAVDLRQLKKLAKLVVSFEEKDYDEVAIFLVDEKRMCALHLEHMGDPSSTDCLSFPYPPSPPPALRFLGDVIVCPKVAMDYVKEHEGDPYEEVALYVIHGLLHLMGYDDLTTKERVKMRAAEKRHLKHMKSAGISLAKSSKA